MILLDTQTLTFNIILDSLEKPPAQPLPPDPYVSNNERVIAAFGRLGDVSEFQLEDIIRIFRLLNSSINAWSLYTTEYMWNAIGYDGPQVPRYPWREQVIVINCHGRKIQMTNYIYGSDSLKNVLKNTK